jgi:choline monooxygenase
MVMTVTDPLPAPSSPATDVALTRRARRLVETKRTELAPTHLRVPLAYYRDPAVLLRERALLTTVPLALVPTARIAQPHDFVVRSVLGTSVLVTRAADGTAHALLNYCRHRGARPAEGCGSARRFACPYHAWTYDSAGRLVGLPGAEGFSEVDQGDYGLVELPSEERHGFVWVVLTVGAAIDVAAHLGPLDGELGSWGLADYDFFTERTFESEVSWKTALEAFAESYHFPYVHGQSIVGMNTVANTATYDRFGPHHRLGFPSPWITEIAEDSPPLDGMALIYWVFPNLTLAVSNVGLEIIDILPSDEPTACTVTHGWMAAVPARDDESVRAGYEDLYEQVHNAVRNEDFAMLPSCGDGVLHGQHDHLLVGRNEPGVQNIVRQLAHATGYELAT